MKDLSAEQEVIIRTDDMCSLSEKRSKPVFSAFLNEQEQYFAQKHLEKRGVSFAFWGGNERCIRKMLCVSVYGDNEEYPIYPLTLKYRKADKPTHRDFLGSFMGLGIKREMIGDIFVSEGHTVVFCTKTARDVIMDSIVCVGKVGVSVSDGGGDELPEAVFEDISINVASQRADCVVSAVTGLSREKTAAFIRAGSFMLNYAECTNVSRNIADGDILTLRGYGKFTVTGEASVTKKGRLRLLLKKYS